MDIYPDTVKLFLAGHKSLQSFNMAIRALIRGSEKYVHIGFQNYSVIKPYNYHVGNPAWYRGMGYYIENTILIFTFHTAFLMDIDMVTEIEIDGIRMWYTDDGYAHYENVRKST